MKITILSIGSRGDVQPMVALGLGLRSSGHEITIATHQIFESFVRKFGLGFSLISSDPKETLESSAGKAALENGHNPLRSWKNFSQMVRPSFIQTGKDTLYACKSSDAVIYSPFSTFFGPHVAEKLKIPSIAAYLQPNHPTRDMPSFLSPTQRNLGSLFNLLTWKFLDFMISLQYRSLINKWRTEYLDLPPIGFYEFGKRRERQRLVVYGISPSVLPKPSDWSENVKVTGYWFLDEDKDWSPPEELSRFLSDGGPPIYIGFGSMVTRDPTRLTSMVLKALEITKQRGILLTGWGCLGETDLPDYAFEINSAPHSWLFPKMAAVVHHGGAGTTAAGLRAGRPTIVVPFFVDQPFWGRTVADLGVGPEPIPFKELSAERLASSINESINNNKIKNRAVDLSKRISSENGVRKAVEEIDKFLSTQ
ncbi:MAG: glycosyltransferase [Thermodesulfobacteriota bacterium]